MSITLRRYACAGIALHDCLSHAFSNHKLVGWGQAPGRLLSGQWDGHSWQEVEDNKQVQTPMALSQVFEMCLFNKDGELRWLRDPQKKALGRAAWISEMPDNPPEGFTALAPLSELSAIDELNTPDGPVTNQCVSQRRARLPGVSTGMRGRYRIREYIGAAPEPAGSQGNRIIVGRRIIEISALEPEVQA